MPAGSMPGVSLYQSAGIDIARASCFGRHVDRWTSLEPCWAVIRRWQPLRVGGAFKEEACGRKRARFLTCKATSRDAQHNDESTAPTVGEKATDDKELPMTSGEESQSESGRSSKGALGQVKESRNSWVKIVAGAAALVFLGSVALGSFSPPDIGMGSGQNESTQVQASSEEAKQLRSQAAAFEALLQQRPSDVDSLEGAGVLYATLGDYSKAADYLEKLVKARPQYVEALRLLAEVKFEARDFSRAAYMYRRAIKASLEESLDLLKGLADTLVSDKRPNEAVDELLRARERIRKAGHQSVTAPAPLDSSEVGQQDTVQRGATAEGAATEAASIDEVPVDLLLAQAYQFADKPDEARSVYDELIADHPDDFRAYLAKGVLLKQMNRDAEAEQTLEEARKLAPEAAKQLVNALVGQPR